MKNPCAKDCEDRCATCHATCERYALYKEEIAKIKEEKEKERRADNLMYENQRICRKRHTSYRQM